MKTIIPAAFALSLIVGAAAQAQTAAPATTGGTATPATPMGTTGTTSGTGVSTSPSPAAVTTTAEPSRTTEAPVAGANSFTEGQVRSRIEGRGFAEVKDLKKDDQGVWRGMAMKDGKSVAVAVDYQGNIVGQ